MEGVRSRWRLTRCAEAAPRATDTDRECTRIARPARTVAERARFGSDRRRDPPAYRCPLSNKSKIFWAVGMFAAFLFILLTGRANVRNFEDVRDSIEEIYEDRLVVNALIYDMSNLLHRKEIAVLQDDRTFFEQVNESVNGQLDDAIQTFRATRLTNTEEATLERFAAGVGALQARERALGLPPEQGSPSGLELDTDAVGELQARMDGLHEELAALSRIQVVEGRRRLGVSDKAVTSMNAFARIENYMLLATAIAMAALVFVPSRNS